MGRCRARPRPGQRLVRRSSADRGATSLELAIIAPMFILLIFFTIQVGLFVYGRTVAVQSAREGVSQLRLAQDPGEYERLRGPAASYVVSYAASVGQQGLTNPSMTSTYDDDAGRVTVQVTGTVITLVPGLNLTTTAEASGTVERFIDPPQLPGP